MVAGDEGVWLAQLRRGAAEHCVLAVLRHHDSYGFELARTLADAGGLVAGEGTIYPLLARLRRRGLVDTTWRESVEGPPRKYYRLTAAGEAALSAFSVEWRRFRDAVDDVLDEGGQQ